MIGSEISNLQFQIQVRFRRHTEGFLANASMRRSGLVVLIAPDPIAQGDVDAVMKMSHDSAVVIDSVPSNGVEQDLPLPFVAIAQGSTVNDVMGEPWH